MVDIPVRDYLEDIKTRNKDYFSELRMKKKKERVKEEMLDLNIDPNKKKYEKKFLMSEEKKKVVKVEMKVKKEKEVQCIDIEISQQYLLW